MNHQILIADDDRSTRVLLERLLGTRGFKVISRDNGSDADVVLQRPQPPQMAILDWEMPGLSGLEVCRRLRARPQLGYTYLILLTAREDRDEIREAFAAGVDDFLTKPVAAEVLDQRLAVARRVVESDMQLQAKQQELALMVQNLEDLAEERAQQLVHTERLATLGTLAAGVAHEVNNPATFISGNIMVLEECWPLIECAIEKSRIEGCEQDEQLDFVLEETPRIIKGVHEGVHRIRKIVDGLKSYARKGGDDARPFDLITCAENALTICHNLLKYNVTVQGDIPVGPLTVVGDAQEIEQVFINIISNAADALSTQDGGVLAIALKAEDGKVSVQIRDNGPGFPAGTLDEIWKPFYTTKEPGKGTGLGMPIVQRIIRNHGGEITAANHPDGGAVITIELPLGEGLEGAAPDASEIPGNIANLQRIES